MHESSSGKMAQIGEHGVFVPLEALDGSPTQVRLKLGNTAGVALVLGALYEQDNRELVGVSIAQVNELQDNEDGDPTEALHHILTIEDPKLHKPFTVGRATPEGAKGMQIRRGGLHEMVSEHHLVVRWADTKHGYGLIIEDCSSNGTYIDEGNFLHVGVETQERESWPKIEYGVAQISKKSLLDPADRGKSHNLTAGDDTAVILPSRGRFDVLDGAGGHDNGAQASRMAAKLLRQKVLLRSAPRTINDAVHNLREDYEEAHKKIQDSPEAGYTTGVGLQMMPELRGDGAREVAWVSVGDSRLYHYDAVNKTVTQVTRDEGAGNVISNALGGAGSSVKQYGSFAGKPGDRLILVSDGVTGDSDLDNMTPEKMLQILNDCPGSPEQAAHMLMRWARKIDDRTAVVIEIPGSATNG